LREIRYLEGANCDQKPVSDNPVFQDLAAFGTRQATTSNSNELANSVVYNGYLDFCAVVF
jgi:hypothetical protein